MCFKPLHIRLNKEEMLREFPHLFKSYHQGNYFPRRYREVKCGKCLDCQKKYSREWVFRLKQESNISINQTFVSPTYRPDDLQPENYYKDRLVVNKKHLRDFIKVIKIRQTRLLKKLNTWESKTWPRLKYYACGEYGGKFMRPHYHIVFFNLHPLIQAQIKDCSYDAKETDVWKYGNVDVEPLKDNGIIYVTKYLGKDHHPKGILKEHMPFNIMSPNIGSSYLRPWNHRYHETNREYKVPVNDYKIPMPEYYKKKFYSEAARSILCQKSYKEYHERNEALAKKHGLTLEQFEAWRQREAIRKYKKRKEQFLIKES